MKRIYLDTSAYLCILLGEAGSERLSKETASAELLSSVLLVLEATRTLVRLAREGALGVKWAAAAGDAEAQYRLAWLHVEGLGVPRDHDEARKLFAKAAARDHVPAQDAVASVGK